MPVIQGCCSICIAASMQEGVQFGQEQGGEEGLTLIMV